MGTIQSTGIKSVSIKNLLSGGGSSANNVNVSDKTDNNAPSIAFPDLQITDADLQKVWKEYAFTIQNEKPHFHNLIANRIPILSNETEIIVELLSHSQESEVIKEKDNILNYLKIKLQNNRLQLKTIISKNNEPIITEAITASEKLKVMTSKNPAFAKLCAELNLELV